MKSIISKLKKASKQIAKNYSEEIVDIILFGSLMRGKEKPRDIDILLLFKSKVNKEIEYEFRSKVSDVVSVVSKTEKNYKIREFPAREGVLFEGYSLIKSKYIAEEYGFTSFGLFQYITKNLSNTKKTRFYYALNGRGESEGIIKRFNGIKLSDNIILFSLSSIEPAKDFFEYWELNYTYVPLLLPERLAKSKIIGRVR